MPKAKTNRGKAKTISCPRCGKKFYSETNVLQHMNQPLSLCRVLWHEEEYTHLLHQLFEPGQNRFMEDESGGIVPETEADLPQDRWVPPGSQDDNHSHSGEFGTAGDPSDRFTETYEGCSKVYPGGKTFMDTFQMDQYTEERTINPYFPFASREEWQFASWLLHSRLSLKAIDSLLSLDIVSPSAIPDTPLLINFIPDQTNPSLLSHRKTAPCLSRNSPSWPYLGLRNDRDQGSYKKSRPFILPRSARLPPSSSQ